jgi:hypothetical protein
MRSDAKANQVVIALAKAIETTFAKGDWLELGLLTESDDLIHNHRRLLRSLEWGDSDYSGCIIDVLPRVLADTGGRSKLAVERYPNLAVVEDKVGLRKWLADHDRQLHDALYASDNVASLDDLDDAAGELGITEIDMHAARIRKGLRDDPGQAIGSAKELLETTLKAILGLHGTGPETKLDVPVLVKRVNVQLGLDAAGVEGGQAGATPRRKVLGSLAQIVYSAAELRNAGLGTGHGISQGPVLDVPTARMVVSAAVTVASFYAEAYTAAEKPTRRSARPDDVPF